MGGDQLKGTPGGVRSGKIALARWQLLGAAVLFSTAGAAIKSCALSGPQIAGARSLVAAIAIALLLPVARRSITRSALVQSIPYALTLVLFVTANKFTTAAAAIFLQSAAPLYLCLLGPLLLSEQTRGRDLVLLGVMAGGLLLVLMGGDEPAATAPNPLLGNLLATACGVTWALTLGGFRWLRVRSPGAGDPTLGAILIGNIGATLAMVPLSLDCPVPRTQDVALILYLGAAQIGLAYYLLTRAMRHVPALDASLILLAEPALNPLWVWLVHDEVPGVWTVVGGAVILGAVTLRTLASAPAPAPAADDASTP